MEEAGRGVRGIFLCCLPQRHDGGHRDIVTETVFCVYFNHLSIYMDPFTTCVEIKKKLARKKMYGCFVSSMMKLFDASKKVRSKVETTAYY